VDLLSVYNQWLQIVPVDMHVPYVTFLKKLHELAALDDARPPNAMVKLWDALIEYFTAYLSKVFPLLQFRVALDDFIKERPIEPSQVNSGLWCQACLHLFTNASVYQNHLTGKKHLRNSSRPPQISEASDDKEKVLHSTRLTATFFVTHFTISTGLIRATVEELERRQALMPEELAREDELRRVQEASVEDALLRSSKRRKFDEGEDERELLPQDLFDGGVYNPLKLPLDWDGKPIPYWLYKLHGLGVKYPCEICPGGAVYAGRRAFDVHFSDQKHLQGLRLIGIASYTSAFYHVTKVDEAKALHDRLRQQQRQEVFRPDAMEEVEDHVGNVYTRKTFQDLQRQGLL
jgi:splicing factor 3A subunit 3